VPFKSDDCHRSNSDPDRIPGDYFLLNRSPSNESWSLLHPSLGAHKANIYHRADRYFLLMVGLMSFQIHDPGFLTLQTIQAKPFSEGR